MHRTRIRGTAILCCSLLVLIAQAVSQTPSVRKVEPPNWWAGLPENPMLLVYGAGLDGAKVRVCAGENAGPSTTAATAPKPARERQVAAFAREDGKKVCASYPGLTVQKVEPGNEGYLFVWLKIAARAKPGTAKFVINGKKGSAEFDFPILKRKGCERKDGTNGPSAAPLHGSAQDDTDGNRRTEYPSGCHVGIARSDVMYLIMPDRFANGDSSNDDPPGAKGHFDRQQPKAYHGGDLKGVEDHLPYLKDLGVTALWLTPFWKNDSNSADYHGYHVTDFYGVDEHFGSMQDFQSMVRAAHADGMKFVFDYVVNHIGPYHAWARNPPLATWLHGTVENHRKFDYHFEYLVDPHAPKAEWEDITDGWFPTAPPANALPDLNVDDPHVAKYLLDNAIWWMEMGDLDAFRLDTFPYSSRKFWSYWHRELFRIYPTANTIGEVYNFDPTITSFFEGGRKEWDGIDDGLPTMFDFPVQGAIRDVLIKNRPATTLQMVMRFDGLYLRPDELVTFIGNHDTKRFLGEDGSSPEKLKAAFGLLMTLRGIPQIYYGDEIGMTGGDDPDNRHDFPGGWKGDTQDAFTSSSLSPTAGDNGRAQGRTEEQQEIFEYLRDLIALRKAHPALQDGHQWTIGAAEKYFAYLRDDGKEKILVVFNKGTEPIKLELKDTPMEQMEGLVPLNGASNVSVTDGVLTIDEPRYGVGIYEVK